MIVSLKEFQTAKKSVSRKEKSMIVNRVNPWKPRDRGAIGVRMRPPRNPVGISIIKPLE